MSNPISATLTVVTDFIEGIGFGASAFKIGMSAAPAKAEQFKREADYNLAVATAEFNAKLRANEKKLADLTD